MSRRRKLGFTVITLALFLGLAEVGCRLFLQPLGDDKLGIYDMYRVLDYGVGSMYQPDKQLFWRLKGNINLDMRLGRSAPFDIAWNIKTNDMGCRIGGTANSQVAEEPIRLLFVGESTFFGFNANVEESIPVRVGGLLDGGLQNKKVVAYNCAVPGFSLFQTTKMLPELIDKLKPDAILVGFAYNDMLPAPLTDADAWQQNNLWRSLWNSLLRSSRLLQGFWRTRGLFASPKSSARGRRVSDAQLEDYLGRLLLIAREASARLFLFNTNFVSFEGAKLIGKFCSSTKTVCDDLPATLLAAQQRGQRLEAKRWQKLLREKRLPGKVVLSLVAAVESGSYSVEWSTKGKPPQMTELTAIGEADGQTLWIGHLDVKEDLPTTKPVVKLYYGFYNDRLGKEFQDLAEHIQPKRLIRIPTSGDEPVVLPLSYFNQIPYKSERVHPNAAGYQVLAKRVAKLVQQHWN